jgi:CRISPR/Cas system CMR subunit Cmr4 (Cas7 group RAMP superfamily)|tara:strand:- start:884 stop:1177 length:294 start_codon:yes stop_codon:yes gene_type:complete
MKNHQNKKPVKAFMGLGVEVFKKAKESGAKGIEFLSPIAMAGRILKGKKKSSAVPESSTNVMEEIDNPLEKKTGEAKLKLGGEVTVGKGGDYIKDLI